MPSIWPLIPSAEQDGVYGALTKYFLYNIFEHNETTPHNDTTAHGGLLEQQVRDGFKNYPEIIITQGRVPDVLVDVAPEKIAFMYLDLNHAESEVGALEVFFDRMVPGVVLILYDHSWIIVSKNNWKIHGFWPEAITFWDCKLGKAWSSNGNRVFDFSHTLPCGWVCLPVFQLEAVSHQSCHIPRSAWAKCWQNRASSINGLASTSARKPRRHVLSRGRSLARSSASRT